MSAGIKRRRATTGASAAIDRFPSVMPTGNLSVDSSMGVTGTWVQIFANDFNYTVPVGGIVPNSTGTALVAGSYAKVNTDIDNWASFYANNANSSWGEKTSQLQSGEPGYPGTYLSHAKWYPSKTVEFRDSCFVVKYHAEDLNGDGTMYGLGAAMNIRNPSNPSVWKMGPYLRYQYRMRHTNHVGLTPGQTSYWTSVPLAIDSANWPGNGEFDWTECDANKVVEGNYHPAYTSNETWHVTSGESAKVWNTFTVEWVPGRVKFWTNNVLRWNTTDRVPTGQMSIVMQHEQNWRAGVGSADMEMDWLSIWAYTP